MQPLREADADADADAHTHAHAQAHAQACDVLVELYNSVLRGCMFEAWRGNLDATARMTSPSCAPGLVSAVLEVECKALKGIAKP
eukprot:354777-Chlamydomonas_euryale.AAC.4